MFYNSAKISIMRHSMTVTLNPLWNVCNFYIENISSTILNTLKVNSFSMVSEEEFDMPLALFWLQKKNFIYCVDFWAASNKDST